MAGIAVRRVHGITPEVFQQEFVATQTPVTLTGLDAAEFAREWEPSRVIDALGDREFWFKRSANDAHPNFRAETLGEMFARERMTFAEFFARITEAPPHERCRLIFTGDEHYLARSRNGIFSVNPELAALWETVRIPALVSEEVYSAWGWLSGRGVHTWLHYDNNGCHNLNLQLHGRKRCLLFAPDTLHELDFFEPGDPVPAYNCSRLDLDSAAGNARLERVPFYEAILEPGELLFIPAHWIHAFWHLGDYNANVNFWFKPHPSEAPRVDDNAVARRERELPHPSREET